MLNLEIDSSFGVKAGKQPLEVFFEINGVEDTLDLAPTRSGTVDEDRTGQSTIVTLDVKADAADVPVTDAAFPRTAIGQVRSGLGSCTGTLVDRSWVLTVASCLAADPATVAAGAPAAPVRVLFGADIANDKTTGGTGAGSKVTQVQPAAAGADAVMLKLETPIDTITPIAPATAAPTVGENLAFTGYGRTASAWVPLAAHSYTYPVTAVGGSLTASATGASLCLGDGGAPGIRTVNGTSTLAVIASTSSQAGCVGFGIPVGTASVTSTRVDTIAPWIATTIQNGLNTTAVSAADKALAQQIIDRGRVTAAAPVLSQLQGYASGVKRANIVSGEVRDCTIDSSLLGALKKVVVDDGFSITISSLNEYCLGTATTATDYHSRNGGGHAVKITMVNGVAATGATVHDLALRTAMFAALPAPAGIGQLDCRPRAAAPAGWAQFASACTHDYFEYRGGVVAQTPVTAPSFDVDGDTYADVLGISTTNQLNIYSGAKTGGWLTRTLGSTGWDATATIVHGDYNSDGKGDFVTVENDGTVWFHEGDGARGFTKSLIGSNWPGTTYLTGGVDFTGDGRADMIGRGTNGNIFLYAGTGAGTFIAGVHFNAGWGHMTALLAGDFSGDGKGDLVARDTAGILWLFRGDGVNLTPAIQVGNGWNIMSVITGGVDYNGDGKADILGRTTAGQFWLYAGTGSGFQAPTNPDSGWNMHRLLT
ncbi:FG-GAP-like repeat-containing protein [Microbacterium sp. GCS4]|uniref:FG-GAP-like repeat-containing protein n=1 Tax=Microbacterium sp. GCS4 TaxID=1692239 RepID=UPI0013792C85|nr:FG-GAP-like repeat-containing protein [Microbacterium sp. GCS4]